MLLHITQGEYLTCVAHCRITMGHWYLWYVIWISVFSVYFRHPAKSLPRFRQLVWSPVCLVGPGAAADISCLSRCSNCCTSNCFLYCRRGFIRPVINIQEGCEVGWGDQELKAIKLKASVYCLVLVYSQASRLTRILLWVKLLLHYLIIIDQT